MKRSVRPYCSHCKHDSHRGRVCGYGKDIGTTFALCACNVDKKGRVVDTIDVGAVDLAVPVVAESADTRFAAALDEASRAFALASTALATAAKEARIARADAMAADKPAFTVTPVTRGWDGPVGKRLANDLHEEDLDVSVSDKKAVRILHKPSKIVVECSEYVSSIKNKASALSTLRDRLLGRLDVLPPSTPNPLDERTTVGPVKVMPNLSVRVEETPLGARHNVGHWTNGASLDPETALRAATLGDGPRKVLAAMALYPTGATSRQLVAQTSFSARTITNYTSELRGAGLVERGSSTITSAGHNFLRANPIAFTAKVLEPGLRAVLVVMAKYPNGPTARQICLHTKFSARTVTNYVSELRGRGYVVRGELKPTDEGRKLVADEVGAVRTGEDLFKDRLAALGGGEAAVARAIWELHPGIVTSADLQERTGFSARTITNYLSTLRGHMLVARGSISLSSEMAAAHDGAS
jgi:hypothetical protein